MTALYIILLALLVYFGLTQPDSINTIGRITFKAAVIVFISGHCLRGAKVFLRTRTIIVKRFGDIGKFGIRAGFGSVYIPFNRCNILVIAANGFCFIIKLQKSTPLLNERCAFYDGKVLMKCYLVGLVYSFSGDGYTLYAGPHSHLPLTFPDHISICSGSFSR